MSEYRQFLMVGRRWDTPITQSVDYSDSGWNEIVRTAALSANEQRDWWWIDYFVFSRGFFGKRDATLRHWHCALGQLAALESAWICDSL